MRISLGQIMTQTFAGIRRQLPRVTNALIVAGVLLLAPAILSSRASAQALGYAAAPQSLFPSDNIMLAPTEPALTDEGDGSGSVVPERLRRAVLPLTSPEPPAPSISHTST